MEERAEPRFQTEQGQFSNTAGGHRRVKNRGLQLDPDSAFLLEHRLFRREQFPQPDGRLPVHPPLQTNHL